MNSIQIGTRISIWSAEEYVDYRIFIYQRDRDHYARLIRKSPLKRQGLWIDAVQVAALIAGINEPILINDYTP
jgi:hypothetical protein